MQILDGKACAAELKSKIKVSVDSYIATHGRPPGLAVIIVGENPSSQVYVKYKLRACKEVGIFSEKYELPTSASYSEVEAVIEKLNQQENIDGILLQLPLPDGLCSQTLINKISPFKDVDCLTTENSGLLWSGQVRVSPCTPQGIIELLKYYNIKIEGQRVVVIGRSAIVGRPMFELLQKQNATVTLCHSKTKNLSYETKQADIVVVAAGVPHMLSDSDFKESAVVVDVGIHKTENGLVGDVVPLSNVAYASPVPGGVGPMTIACLLKNTLKLAEQK